MPENKNQNIVVEIIIASLIVGGIYYFFNNSLPKQTQYYAAPGCGCQRNIPVFEQDECIMPEDMMEDYPDNEPNWAKLTPDDQQTWDKKR